MNGRITNEPIISVRGISKQYFINKGSERTGRRGMVESLLAPYRVLKSIAEALQDTNGNAFWAIKDISFDLYHGERLGIIGRNGAGKTTLLRILSRMTYPTEGIAIIRGIITPLFAVGTGFQGNLTGRQNIFLNASLHGLTKAQIQEKFADIVEFSEIEKFVDTPIKHYSKGMKARLAFSIAAHLDPDILILDEVLSVGDIAFQEKCLKRVHGLTGGGRTLRFVSHSMSSVCRFCNRVIWLDEGRIVMDGVADEVCDAYLSQVTRIRSEKRWSVTLPAGTTDASDDEKERADRKRTAGSDNDGSAPGSEHVRLVSVRVINERRQAVVSVSADQPVGLEMVYDVFSQEKILSPAFRFYSDEDILLFVAVDTDPAYMRRIKPVGRYCSTTWIPGHLLNVGTVSVTAIMTTPGPKLDRHFELDKVIAFQVLEVPFGKEGAAGLHRKPPGAVRPKLVWETEQVESRGTSKSEVAR